jgi:hypothetical protein
MLLAQGGACAVCLKPLLITKSHVDHDHDSGAVRGILCFNCNGGLGQFKDDADVIRRAAEYLERHRRSDAS